MALLGSTGDVMLVNGEESPVLDIIAGTWYRFRIAFLVMEATASFQFDSASCEMQLLAKDGSLHATEHSVSVWP